MKAYVYTEEKLKEVVAQSDSLADVIRYFGVSISGSRYVYIQQLIQRYDLDTSHFTRKSHQANKAKNFKRKKAEELLVIYSKDSHRAKAELLTRAMMELGIPYECITCHISEWQGKPLVLDVDHIDGNRFDCRVENLRFLCPNCHRQTPTFARRKNIDDSLLVCECGNPKQKRSKTCTSCYATRKHS